MDFVEVAKRRDEIMHSQGIYCPKCNKKQFSPFDKLYTSIYDECYFCTDENVIGEDELIRRGDNVFAIIEA